MDMDTIEEMTKQAWHSPLPGRYDHIANVMSSLQLQLSNLKVDHIKAVAHADAFRIEAAKAYEQGKVEGRLALLNTNADLLADALLEVRACPKCAHQLETVPDGLQCSDCDFFEGEQR